MGRTDLLPMLTLTWLTGTKLLAAGHNCVPITFNLETSGSLTLGARLEEDKKLETRLNTTHQNQISELRIHEGNKDNVTTISTVAGDGKLVIWNIKTLASKMANLKI